MPSRAFGMRRGSAGGPRAGASLRLLNQQRARQARPSTSEADRPGTVIWRDRR